MFITLGRAEATAARARRAKKAFMLVAVVESLRVGGGVGSMGQGGDKAYLGCSRVCTCLNMLLIKLSFGGHLRAIRKKINGSN